MEQELVTIKTFYYDSETLLYVPKLENAGIYHFLKDQQTVSADPVVSNAIGGIKLQVNAKDVIAAKAIITEIDANREESHLGKELLIAGKTYIGTLKECPRCESEKTYKEQLRFWDSLLFRKGSYYCGECKHQCLAA